MIKNFLNVFAKIGLVLGIIFTILCFFLIDWFSAVFILFWTIVYYVILYSLYTIIDNQEKILFKLSDSNLKILSGSNESKKLKEDQWCCIMPPIVKTIFQLF